MGQSSSNRVVSRFTETNAPPNNVALPTDYLNEPLTTLEGSLKNMHSRLDDLDKHIINAKAQFNSSIAHNLTRDEAAAIYLYTLEWPSNGISLYTIFNQDLRTKDNSKIKHWLPFLKLLMTAMNKMPSKQLRVYRGLRGDVSKEYTEGLEFVWASATSCSRSINMACNFFANSNGECVLFQIDVQNGKDISAFSHFKLEEEVLLRPGTRFRVTKKPQLEKIDSMSVFVVHLQEV
ncbi:unnamed protein product [Adineta ricciae]|uniref:NAD(P)(+)--arginine ADP-ribosyltransferase n=1 Tax=Adineta ricciae TaxID=249248 RepID=A0A814F079_ADIRI|nr:unnamed protein product [Adineta ricciae]CAF1271663.1 unnamed protein product [Adineta ricciae]